MPDYYLEYLQRTDRFPQSVYHRAKHALVRDLFAWATPSGRVLDAACGVGNITGKYAVNHQLVGIDEQADAIRICQRNYRGRYLQGTIYQLPFRNESFGLILFLDAIEHFTDPVRALRELSRVLRPGGRILICTINYANPLWFILENTWHRLFAGTCRTYSPEVHPTRYHQRLLRQHCQGLFREVRFERRILMMELFYIGEKPAGSLPR